eukprot:Seg2715.3 transcript_id=Seg2715.3/GoldUCD/mRNA.D3Y31 product="hypothetical protein" protein_id=Seg2715.3/GoldUCD/D3Y31
MSTGHTRKAPPPDYSVTVKDYTGGEEKVTVNDEWSVKSLKEQIITKGKWLDCYRFRKKSCNGTLMEDKKVLGDYTLHEGSIIYMETWYWLPHGPYWWWGWY